MSSEKLRQEPGADSVPGTSLPQVILLVDDHDAYRQVIHLALTKRFPHHEILGVGSAKEAEAMAQERKLAVLVTDIALTDGSGFELVEALRRTCLAPPQFVLCSNYGVEEMGGGLAKHGIRHFVHKGDGLGALTKAVGDAINESLAEVSPESPNRPNEL